MSSILYLEVVSLVLSHLALGVLVAARASDLDVEDLVAGAADRHRCHQPGLGGCRAIEAVGPADGQGMRLRVEHPLVQGDKAVVAEQEVEVLKSK